MKPQKFKEMYKKIEQVRFVKVLEKYKKLNIWVRPVRKILQKK